MRRTLLAIVVNVLAVACGNDSHPTAPSPPSAPPTLTTLTITVPDVVLTGLQTPIAVTANFSNGTTENATANVIWTATGAGGFDSQSIFRSNLHGATTVTATYRGQSVAKTIRAVQNYRGSWQGTYLVLSCDQSGFFTQIHWCQVSDPPGRTGRFVLDLTQLGNDYSQIGGTFALGSIAGRISGSVTGDGRLNIGGTYIYVEPGFAIQVTVGGWDTQAVGANNMAGGWTQSIVNPGLLGNAYEQLRIVTAAHLTVN